MDELTYNREHYKDPTVFLALKNIEREDRLREQMRESMKNKRKKNRKRKEADRARRRKGDRE